MIIAGAGGHAREIFMLLQKEVKSSICFFDNTCISIPDSLGGAPVLRTEKEARDHLKKDSRFIIGTGNPAVRKKMFDLFSYWGGEPFTFQATTAFVSDYESAVGDGSNIMHSAFISCNVQIGMGCLINAMAHLHHDVIMGNFCEVGPAALLLGKVQVGNFVFIGAGAILLPDIKIADGAIIGAGAVVTKNVLSDQKVKGIPAV